MAQPLLNLARCIWAFFMGSLRMVLFFCCVMLLLVQIMWLAAIFYTEQQPFMLEATGSSVGTLDYVYAFFMVGLALLGCYGAFYKHRQSIKAFSLMSGFSAGLLLMMVVYTMNPTEIAKMNEKVTDYYSNLAHDYNFKPDYEKSKANSAWDTLQSLHCCGLNGPEDWAKWAPSAHVLPSSCCFPPLDNVYSILSDRQCHKSSAYKMGCIDRLLKIETASVVSMLFMMSYLLILSFISCFFETFTSEPDAGRARHLVVTTDQQAIPISGGYQNSVYPRQPSTNPEHNDMFVPLYPNASNVEKGGHGNASYYSAPPPKYGSSR